MSVGEECDWEDMVVWRDEGVKWRGKDWEVDLLGQRGDSLRSQCADDTCVGRWAVDGGRDERVAERQSQNTVSTEIDDAVHTSAQATQRAVPQPAFRELQRNGIKL